MNVDKSVVALREARPQRRPQLLCCCFVVFALLAIAGGSLFSGHPGAEQLLLGKGLVHCFAHKRLEDL